MLKINLVHFFLEISFSELDSLTEFVKFFRDTSYLDLSFLISLILVINIACEIWKVALDCALR